jgi:UDP-N-acetylmuramoyl-L-alanyl-D-glutamate--2,6-diaminopimelate ligase
LYFSRDGVYQSHQDHLDYHLDMEDYFAAKAKLFSPDYLQGKAIINLDDAYGQRLAASLSPQQVLTYSVSDARADFYTKDLHYQPTGVEGVMVTPQGEIAFASPLVGQYNLANLLAAVAAVLECGVDLGTGNRSNSPVFRSTGADGTG